MQLGLIGLGKMGFNMRSRLRDGGHEVVGYDPRPEVSDVGSLADLAAALQAPRVVWVMVPSGSITDQTITQLAEVLGEGDLVIDGGNSRYTEDGPHAKLLADKGVSEDHVHHEVFHVTEDGSAPPRRVEVDTSAPAEAIVTVNLDGRTTRVEMPSKAETILDATLRARPDAPFACTGGVCGTCRARVVSGEVTMERNYALEPDEVAAGLVLSCQSHPVTDEVTLDYDS